MRKTKITAILLSVALVFGSCGTMNNTAKGTAIGGGGGAAVGAILGGSWLIYWLRTRLPTLQLWDIPTRWVRRRLISRCLTSVHRLYRAT